VVVEEYCVFFGIIHKMEVQVVRSLVVLVVGSLEVLVVGSLGVRSLEVLVVGSLEVLVVGSLEVLVVVRSWVVLALNLIYYLFSFNYLKNSTNFCFPHSPEYSQT